MARIRTEIGGEFLVKLCLINPRNIRFFWINSSVFKSLMHRMNSYGSAEAGDLLSEMISRFVLLVQCV